MLSHYQYNVRALDAAVRTVLRTQCVEQGAPFYGTIEQLDKGYTGAHSAIGAARQLLEGFYTPESAFYRDARLPARIEIAVRFALSMQHEDGTFDLLETNFHDGAETSFIMQNIGPAILLMRSRMENTPEEKNLYELLVHLVDRCADGILAGGFHTPNHRWVLSAALSLCSELTGREDCLVKMRALLNEGIDCDEEGEYTERSSGVYNVICDRALITLAQLRGMTELYAHVARNLRMIFKYIEPDWTINTINSTRQDVGTAPDWRIYYSIYLYMALQTGDEEFRWMADRMLEQSQGQLLLDEERASRRELAYFEFMPFWEMDARLQNEWTADGTRAPSFDYVKHFVQSGIVRARRGNFSLTLLEKRPVFAMMQFGGHTAYFRLAGTFYAHGQFAADAIEETEDGFLLTYRRRWGYKGPLPEKPETTDWNRMDHSKRPDVMMQDFVFNVHVRLLENGASFHVTTEGVECVLTKFEILLQPGACYATGDMEMRAHGGDYVYQKGDAAFYQYADHTKLRIEGGCWKHSFGEKMRNSLQGDEKSFFVAMTAQTPMDETFTLRFEGWEDGR